MSKKIYWSFILLCGFVFLYPQKTLAQENENPSEKKQPMLVFFSEDGIRFWVSINGEKQNKIASANVKIPVSQDNWAKAKIIFENENLPELSKNVMMSTQGEIVYRIKKTRKKYVVRWYSGGTAGAGEGEDESNKNIQPCYTAMNSGMFFRSLGELQKETFENNKLSTSKQIVNNNCLSTDQVISIIKTFQYEATRLEFAKYAYKRTTDRENYHLLNGNFEYSLSKDELNAFINRQK